MRNRGESTGRGGIQVPSQASVQPEEMRGNSLAIAAWAGWHLFSLALLVAVAGLSLPEPRAISPDKVQVLLLGVGYLALSLYIVAAAERSRNQLYGHLTFAAIAGFAGTYFALRMRHLPASPWILGIGGTAAAIAALVPYLSGKARSAMAILFITAAAMLAASSRLRPAADKIEKQSLDTALYELNLETYADLVPPPAADGGAIKSHGSALMLLTGDGKFYWITESVGGLHAEALKIPAPMDRAAYLAGFSDPSKAPRLRTTDLIFDRSPAPTSLYVAHQSWDIKNRCYTQRVSVMALAWTMDGHPRASGAWRALFDSKPCVRAEGPFDDSETGGKLAWAPDGRLLFTLGSLGFAGLNGQMPFSQRSDVDYGKILKIDPGTGQYTIFTTGNRNPQGLVVTGDGQIWEAEHGPQGGDEINFIEQGANYGWPYATYGTDYGSKTWPLNPDGHDHGVYHEPAIAFVPSAAISPLIELNGAEFPHWKGDLLAGSLRTEALFRIRTRGTLVIYVESFSVGHRVRDLAEMANGRIVVWSDDGTLIELSRNDYQSVFAASCASCHEPKFGAAVGPPLAGVVGRRIASAPGFTYSRGLRSQSGVWDERTLDAFLRDPAAFASGTTMQRIRLDDKSRAAVIAELKAKH